MTKKSQDSDALGHQPDNATTDNCLKKDIANESDGHSEPIEPPPFTAKQISHELLKQLTDGASDIMVTIPVNEPVKKKPEKTTLCEKKVLDHIRGFNHNPKDIKQYLDRFIIGQTDAKKALSTAICDHYNYIKASLSSPNPTHYTKQNILMIGPTGVGKTDMIKRIAELIGVPFVKSDATTFSETGYQGRDVDDLIRQLYKTANENKQLTELGIVYLDEIDKISGTTSKQYKDVSGRGVQTSLLKLMEDTDIPIQQPWDFQSQMKQLMDTNTASSDSKLNTKHILFIMSGAFNALNDIIMRRIGTTAIGFSRQPITHQQRHLSQIQTADLVQFGLEPEFIGRLPIRVLFSPLDETDLYTILTRAEASILEAYKFSFERFGIEVTVHDDALKMIAKQSLTEKTGARGLATTLNTLFRNHMFEYPSTSIHFLFVTPSMVENPEKHLLDSLNDAEKFLNESITAYIHDVLNRHPNNCVDVDTLAKQAINHRGNVQSFVTESIHNYAHML